MSLRVAVLSHRSLLAGGIASQLREHADVVEVHSVDAGLADVLEQLRTIQPTIIVRDAADVEAAARVPIDRLLEAVPETHVVQISPASDHVRIISSVQCQARGIGELLQVMQSLTSQTERRPGAGNSQSRRA